MLLCPLRKGGEHRVAVGLIDNIAVNLIREYKEIIFPADRLNPRKLLLLPHAARRVVGAAEYEHRGRLRLLLKILKINGKISVLINELII